MHTPTSSTCSGVVRWRRASGRIGWRSFMPFSPTFVTFVVGLDLAGDDTCPAGGQLLFLVLSALALVPDTNVRLFEESRPAFLLLVEFPLFIDDVDDVVEHQRGPKEQVVEERDHHRDPEQFLERHPVVREPAEVGNLQVKKEPPWRKRPRVKHLDRKS